MRQHQVVGDRQTKASSGAGGPRRIGLVEAFKDPAEVLWLDAHASVRHPQFDPLSAAAGTRLNATSRGGELGRVAEPIRQHLAHPAGVSAHPQLRALVDSYL